MWKTRDRLEINPSSRKQSEVFWIFWGTSNVHFCMIMSHYCLINWQIPTFMLPVMSALSIVNPLAASVDFLMHRPGPKLSLIVKVIARFDPALIPLNWPLRPQQWKKKHSKLNSIPKLLSQTFHVKSENSHLKTRWMLIAWIHCYV